MLLLSKIFNVLINVASAHWYLKYHVSTFLCSYYGKNNE